MNNFAKNIFAICFTDFLFSKIKKLEGKVIIPEELINANQKFESKVEATNISENAPSAAIRRWSPKYGLSLNEAILGTTKSQNNL